MYIADELYTLMTNPPDRKIWNKFCSKFNPKSWTDCWEWEGFYQSNGRYSIFQIYLGHGKSKTVRGHRQIMVWLCGDLGKLETDHVVCSNHRCVNPLHLIPTTHKINTLRGSSPAAVCARNGK